MAPNACFSIALRFRDGAMTGCRADAQNRGRTEHRYACGKLARSIARKRRRVRCPVKPKAVAEEDNGPI